MNMPSVATFVVVFLAELGDKTQLMIIALASHYTSRLVWVGGILAFALINGAGVLIGDALPLPTDWIKRGAGGLFIAFGLLILLRRDKNEKMRFVRYGPLLASFLSVLLAELGDKTQLSVMMMAANFNSPLQVFGGAMGALGLVSIISVLVGKAISNSPKVKAIGGVAFIAFGILFILD
jgi:putative Ca2+/H+ antiporter (TMEM165/GDT1 family)